MKAKENSIPFILYFTTDIFIHVIVKGIFKIAKID